MNTKVGHLYDSYVSMLTKFQSPVLLILRLYWGWQFFLAGRGKLMNLDRTAEYFTTLNIPVPKLNAIMAGGTECFGGLLLLLGLGGFIVPLPLIVTMLVAYATAHREQLENIFSDSDAFVTAPPFLFILAAIIVLIFGPGALSVDALIKKIRGKQ